LLTGHARRQPRGEEGEEHEQDDAHDVGADEGEDAAPLANADSWLAGG